MAYVQKIISKDENMIGIARLHWIYVLKGIMWFLGFALLGWGMNYALSYGIMHVTAGMSSPYLPLALMRVNNGMMFFLLGGGFLIFALFTMKILFAEVGLSSRRILYKEGMIFVKVRQIDLEEIRGEFLDLGHLGKFLGYGYLMLDCRFIGDVRLPALEAPERFLKALHDARAVTQDALSVVVGKGNPATLNVAPPVDGDQSPGVQPAPPQPEIQPGQPAPEPEVQPQTPLETPASPTPHAPPPQPAKAPPLEVPKQPPQPIPSPVNPEPPLQPPGEAAPPPNVVLDPQAVAQVVQQVMPQMAKEVVKEIAAQGLIQKEEAEPEEDKDLMESFDDARRQKKMGGGKLEHVIH